MVQAKFYINGNEVNPPKNAAELAIELNYSADQFPNAGTVNITDLIWVRENYEMLMKHINDGLTGGNGIFEGPTQRIDFTDFKSTITGFNGFIDLTEAKIKDRISITAKSVSHATIDWLNQVAAGFGFEYLASLNPGEKGYISPDLYKFIPYVNNSVPNYMQSAVLSLMIFNVTQSIIQAIKSLSKDLADVGGYFTTIPAIIKFILELVYIITLVIVLVKLVNDCLKFIISPVKYHAGMYVRDLMERASDYLNMNFESDIWDTNSPYHNEVILPEKLYSPPSKLDDTILGFLVESKNEQKGFFKGSFADLINAMKVKYNAKVIVKVPQGGATATNRGIISIMRRDKNPTQPTYQLPDIYQPEYQFNADELQANTVLEYRTDSLDTNTLQDYSGTIYQVICQPKTFENRAFVMMKNYNQVTIPFARASAKTDLTVPEKIVKDFLQVFETIANAIVNVINAIVGVINTVLKIVKKIFSFFHIKIKIDPIPTMKKIELTDTISNRKGMLVLSSDYFNVPKIFILVEGSSAKYNKVSPDNYWLESARAMWDKFHYVNSFLPAPDRPNGNQYIIKTFPKVPFNLNDLIKVMDNNRIMDAHGNEAVIESLKFSHYNQHAEIRVRISKLYTTNLSETYLEPNGQ